MSSVLCERDEQISPVPPRRSSEGQTHRDELGNLADSNRLALVSEREPAELGVVLEPAERCFSDSPERSRKAGTNRSMQTGLAASRRAMIFCPGDTQVVSTRTASKAGREFTLLGELRRPTGLLASLLVVVVKKSLGTNR